MFGQSSDTADVVGRQLFDVARIFDSDVITTPDAMKGFLMPASDRGRDGKIDRWLMDLVSICSGQISG